MENDALYQLSHFAYALAWGGCVGILYEAFGILRMLGSRLLTALADLLFWAVTAIATFLFLLTKSGGAADGYLLAAIAGGAISVHLTVGRPAALLSERVSAGIRRSRRRRKARAARKKQQKNQKNFV